MPPHNLLWDHFSEKILQREGTLMDQILRAGARLASVACTTEVVVIRTPADPVELTIGGEPPVLVSGGDRSAPSAAIREGHGSGSAIGKRYIDDAATIEVLCTKSGDGAIAVKGVFLTPRAAKALPSSD